MRESGLEIVDGRPDAARLKREAVARKNVVKQMEPIYVIPWYVALAIVIAVLLLFFLK